MILAQNQTYESMEQNREARNKHTHLWRIKLGQRRQEYAMEKRQSLQPCWESWTATCKSMKLEHILNTINKNRLKMA